MTARLDAQFAFLNEADRLKSVLRAARLNDASRFENSAEHSWHVMLYAAVLADEAVPEVSIDRVIRMLLIHDIVEIDAGDNPIHGNVDHAAQEAAERAAADRLFALLPDDQETTFRTLWDEFEAAETPDAKFAKAIDRMPTPISNIAQGGGTWSEYHVTMDDMEKRVGVPVKRGAPGLWTWLKPRLEAFFSR